jgi:hypothetical protein
MVYKKRFKEDSGKKMNNLKEAYNIDPKNRDSIDIASAIFSSIGISPDVLAQAYGIYRIVCKLTKKSPIEPYKFLSDIDKKEALLSKVWIEAFYNSALFSLLSVYKSYPEISDFAKNALENEDLKYDLMKAIYTTSPKNLIDLKNIINNLSMR